MRATTIRIGANWFTVHENPFLRPGMVAHTLTQGGRDVYVRHLSEVLISLAGARWHVSGDCCPTAVDGECRCMLGAES